MLIVREYTEDFYKVNLRAGYVEELAKKAARYVNGLNMDICCNLTDHIRLPIIHTKTYISINQKQETRTDRKTEYINAMSSYKTEN